MSQHRAFGETGMSALSLMYVCSTVLWPAIVGLPSATYTCHENIKKRSYEQRDREVENGSFTLSIWRHGTSCNNHLKETGLTDIE